MDNPFASDPDRSALWDMLVARDIDAFLRRDWQAVRGDFIAEGFFGIDAGGGREPDGWRLAFPDLRSYERSWLAQAEDFAARRFRDDPRDGLFAATSLRDIEINGDAALLHKKFDGAIPEKDGPGVRLLWQTLYVCRRAGGRWRIASFVGYLPHSFS
jgi:hypothetical protein